MIFSDEKTRKEKNSNETDNYLFTEVALENESCVPVRSNVRVRVLMRDARVSSISSCRALITNY